jgi:hypothetical protein
VEGGEYRGVLLGESLERGAVIDAPLTVHRISRAAVGDPGAGEPREWTIIEFSIATAQANALVSTLSKTLRAAGGWYCDFHSDAEVVVVFRERVFRYRSGDRPARAEVERYARTMGVPESQLDWPEAD